MNWIRKIYSFDYMGHKKWWFTISAIIIAAGLISLFVKGGGNPVNGLNYGLEFKEGTRITVAFEETPALAEVRTIVSEVGLPQRPDPGDAQRRRARAVPGFQIQTEVLTPAEQDELKQALNEAFTIAEIGRYARSSAWRRSGRRSAGRSSASRSRPSASPCFSSSSTSRCASSGSTPSAPSSRRSTTCSWSSACTRSPGAEVTTATIAAVLTILGYSLYDTVIIYDRIRENQPKLSRLPYGDMVNVSIWEVLTRSINTTMIVLLPVLCLLFFGGATLKDFAFALLIGILSGAYSSIFVASPVLVLLREREPQYKKLKMAARAEEA